MAQQRYTLASELNTGAGDTFPLGLISAAGKSISVFDLMSAVKVAASDLRVRGAVFGTSTIITAGTAQIPQNLTLNGPASSFTASQAPTGATLLAQPFVNLVHQARVTARWLSVDPDSNIYALANGGVNGTLLTVNTESAAGGNAMLSQVWVLE